MVITKDILKQGISINGSWNEKQLNALGTKSINNKGWYIRLLGSNVSEQQIKRFIELKDIHIKHKYQMNLAF